MVQVRAGGRGGECVEGQGVQQLCGRQNRVGRVQVAVVRSLQGTGTET